MNIPRCRIQTNMEAGQALWGIASVLEENNIRKDCADGTDFLNPVQLGCLINAVKIISERIWDENSKMLEQE